MADREQEQAKRERTHLALQVGRLGQRAPVGWSWESKKPPEPDLPPHVLVAMWEAAVAILKRNCVVAARGSSRVFTVADLRAAYPHPAASGR